MPYVFDFDHAHDKPPMDMKDSWVARAPTWPR